MNAGWGEMIEEAELEDLWARTTLDGCSGGWIEGLFGIGSEVSKSLRFLLLGCLRLRSGEVVLLVWEDERMKLSALMIGMSNGPLCLSV